MSHDVYRTDGGGYLDPTRPNHLWVIGVPSGPKINRQQSNSLAANFRKKFVWAKDNSRIYFATNRDPEPYYSTPKTEIHSVPVGGGQSTLLTRIDMGVGALSVSPDGKRVAFNASVVHTPVNSYTQPDLW